MKEKISFYIMQKRFRMNIKHRNSSLLERFRTITHLIILDICIGMMVAVLLSNLSNGIGTLVISNVEGAGVHEQFAEGQGESQVVPARMQDIIAEMFPEAKNEALAVFTAESGLNPQTESNIDIMPDGRPFSIGISQINLTWHELNGVKCYEAFEGKNYKAKVINEKLYEECVELAKDPKINLETARGIYDRSGGNFYKWGAFTSGAFSRYLTVE